ncbi:MAG: hypothetical protein ACRDBG_23465 [Waterburya sp.]
MENGSIKTLQERKRKGYSTNSNVNSKPKEEERKPMKQLSQAFLLGVGIVTVCVGLTMLDKAQKGKEAVKATQNERMLTIDPNEKPLTPIQQAEMGIDIGKRCMGETNATMYGCVEVCAKIPNNLTKGSCNQIVIWGRSLTLAEVQAMRSTYQMPEVSIPTSASNVPTVTRSEPKAEPDTSVVSKEDDTRILPQSVQTQQAAADADAAINGATGESSKPDWDLSKVQR